MQHIIHFHISKGDTHYVARGVDLSIVTQGKSLDELTSNIKEAVELHLDGEDLSDYNLAPNPSVLIDLELPTNIHA